MTRKASSGPKAVAPLSIPKLVVGGPVVAAAIMMLVFIAGVFVINKEYSFDRIVTIPGSLVITDKVTAVLAPHDASIAEIFVHEGEEVQAGQLVARLDNGALDIELAALRKKVTTTSSELAKLQTEASAALGRPQFARIFSSVNTVEMTARISEIDKVVRLLLLRILAAEKKVARAKVYSKTTGRVELVQDVEAGSAIRHADAILKIVDSGDKLRVHAALPRGDGLHFSAGDTAKVIFTTFDGRALGPFPARLRSTSTGSQNARQVVRAEFELIAPRSQIANEIGIQSTLRTEILIKSGELNLVGLLFSAVL